MPLQYVLNLLGHLLLCHCFRRYPGAYRHNLYGNDSHLTVWCIPVIVCIEVCQEVYIRVESDANAVDEQDRQPRL